jgi:hypothetical protein
MSPSPSQRPRGSELWRNHRYSTTHRHWSPRDSLAAFRCASLLADVPLPKSSLGSRTPLPKTMKNSQEGDGKHNPALFCGAIGDQFDDRSLAFLMKTICRIEAGEYDRDLERQTCATSGREFALRQVSPSESSRTTELAFRGRAAWILWTSFLVLSLNC